MSRDFDLSLGSDLSLAGRIEVDTVSRPRRQHVSCERTPSQKPKSDLALWFSSLIYARAVWRLEVSFIIPFVAHKVSGGDMGNALSLDCVQCYVKENTHSHLGP